MNKQMMIRVAIVKSLIPGLIKSPGAIAALEAAEKFAKGEISEQELQSKSKEAYREASLSVAGAMSAAYASDINAAEDAAENVAVSMACYYNFMSSSEAVKIVEDVKLSLS